MKTTPVIERSECPLCGSNERKTLFPVAPEIFLGSNPTIDDDRLQASGLLDLPSIEIVECLKCQMRYCGQLLSPHWCDVFWNDVYIPDQSQAKILKIAKRLSNTRIWSSLFQIILAGTQVADGDTVNVLDLGCGWGDFLMTARSPGVRTIGIEISPPKVAFARSQGLEVYACIEDIPQDVQYHVFHCDQVLEHLPRPTQMLQQIEPLLATEFVGYIGMPDYSDERIAQLSERISGGLEVRDKDLITWDHLNFYSAASFQRLLDVCDFAPVELPGGTRRASQASTAAYIRRSTIVQPQPVISPALEATEPPRLVPRMLQKLRSYGMANY